MRGVCLTCLSWVYLCGQCIGARGDQLTQELEQKRGKANAFSSQKAILKAIAKSDDTDEVEEIRFKIISEMMQIKHIENLKRDATSSEERAALERLLAMDPKAAQLKSRNLSRFVRLARVCSLSSCLCLHLRLASCSVLIAHAPHTALKCLLHCPETVAPDTYMNCGM